MNCKQWIFDMDGTLTDSMTAVWETACLLYTSDAADEL